MARKILIGVVLVGLAWLYSYRILQVPTGLSADEAAFAYNGALLARTGHDQNGRFLPLFVLSLDGRDWRQPVTQYYLAGLFRLFGPSLWLLRFSSVIIAIASVAGIFYLGKVLGGERVAWAAAAVASLAPIMMIQAHLGLDNIMVVPFTIGWLVALYKWRAGGTIQARRKYLIWAAVCLGIGFYTYKGMRAIVPVWAVTTLVYLWLEEKRGFVKNAVVFGLGLAPFVAIMPLIQWKYPGALAGGNRPEIKTYYDFFYPYLSSFDPSFWYVTGDATLFHSTAKHGMFLVATLPVFFIGLIALFGKPKFWRFVLAALITAPLLYGTINSVHRASRLMAIIPAYSLIAGLGISEVAGVKKRRWLVVGTMLLAVFNYADFVKYYWYVYPKFTLGFWGDLTPHESYKILGRVAREKNLATFVAEDFHKSQGESGKFYAEVYLSGNYQVWNDNQGALPTEGVMLTYRQDIPGMTRVEEKLPSGWLQVK